MLLVDTGSIFTGDDNGVRPVAIGVGANKTAVTAGAKDRRHVTYYCCRREGRLGDL